MNKETWYRYSKWNWWQIADYARYFQAGEVGESINRMIIKIDNVLKFSNIEQSNVSAPGGLGSSASIEPQ